jgi:hypothetical protein
VESADGDERRGWRVLERAAPRVTLRRDRRLSLNQAAYDLLGCPAAVALLYDASRRAIGLRAPPGDTAQHFRVQKQGTSTNYLVDAVPFIRHYGIDHSQLTVFEPVQLEEGILVLPLDQARRTGVRPTPNGNALPISI